MERSKTYRMVSRGISDNEEVDFCFEVHKELEISTIKEFFSHFLAYVSWKKEKQEALLKEKALKLHIEALCLAMNVAKEAQ